MPQNDDKQFVSRGGIKLQAAIENWKLNIENLICLDVGSSTGGFVDCLLTNGAKKVYAVDTCYGELAWKLRNDSRVVVMERTNVLRLESLPSVIPAKAGIYTNNMDPRLLGDDDSKVDIVTIDAGWTRLELILPVVKNFLRPGGKIIALLKPHYEANKKDLIRGVLPLEKAEEVKDQVVNRVQDMGFRVERTIESPILGGAGNQEYLLLLL